MKTRVQSSTCYRLLFHIVWIPKKRHHLMRGIQSYAAKVIKGVTSDRYDDVIIEELNVQEDYIHMMAVILPKYSVSTVVGDIKRDSSRLLRQKFTHLKNQRIALWSIGYFVSSVGLDEAQIRRYIRFQDEQDSGQQEAVI